MASDDGRYVHVTGKDGPGAVGGGKYVGGPSPSGGPAARQTGAGVRAPGARGSGMVSAKAAAAAAATGVRAVQQQQASAPAAGWQIVRNEKTETADGYHYLYALRGDCIAAGDC